MVGAVLALVFFLRKEEEKKKKMGPDIVFLNLFLINAVIANLTDKPTDGQTCG